MRLSIFAERIMSSKKTYRNKEKGVKWSFSKKGMTISLKDISTAVKKANSTTGVYADTGWLEIDHPDGRTLSFTVIIVDNKVKKRK